MESMRKKGELVIQIHKLPEPGSNQVKTTGRKGKPKSREETIKNQVKPHQTETNDKQGQGTHSAAQCPYPVSRPNIQPSRSSVSLYMVYGASGPRFLRHAHAQRKSRVPFLYIHVKSDPICTETMLWAVLSFFLSLFLFLFLFPPLDLLVRAYHKTIIPCSGKTWPVPPPGSNSSSPERFVLVFVYSAA